MIAGLTRTVFFEVTLELQRDQKLREGLQKIGYLQESLESLGFLNLTSIFSIAPEPSLNS